jgi:hypothetical protein
MPRSHRLLVANPNDLTWTDLFQSVNQGGYKRGQMIQLNGLRAKNDHRNLTIPEVLLILDPAIDCHQNIELCILRGFKQFTIFEPAKPSTLSRLAFMLR